MASTAFYLCPSWDRSWFLACWHLWRVGLSTSLAWAGLGGFCTTTAVGNRSEHQSQAGRMEAAGGQGLLRGQRNLGCDPGWLAWRETPFSQTGGPRFCRGVLQPQGAGSGRWEQRPPCLPRQLLPWSPVPRCPWSLLWSALGPWKALSFFPLPPLSTPCLGRTS